jgi:hypothetical protein
MNMTLLESYLRRSWSALTSSDEKWTEENPALGQCAVTALVVQDYLGGEIINIKAITPNGEVSHYYNIINGKIVDITIDQFDNSVTFYDEKTSKGGYQSLRDYCLSFEDTAKRYALLEDSVSKYIAKK